MEIQVKMHIWNDLQESKEVVERLVWENLNNKLDQYLNKFNKENAEGVIEINVDKNKKWLFDWKVQANFDWNSFRSEREDFKKLDDLINHLFDHLKLQSSD